MTENQKNEKAIEASNEIIYPDISDRVKAAMADTFILVMAYWCIIISFKFG